MSLLEEAAVWLAGSCRENLAEKVRWIPRGSDAREVDAVPGRTVFRTESDYGLAVRTESRDFIVTAEQMPEEPAKGDMFVRGGRIYEVLAPGDEPVWRWTDVWCRARRIHTKEAGPAEEKENGHG